MLLSGLLVKWNRFAGVHQSYLTYGYAKDASYMEAVQANAELTQRYDDKVSACMCNGCVSGWLGNTMYALHPHARRLMRRHCCKPRL